MGRRKRFEQPIIQKIEVNTQPLEKIKQYIPTDIIIVIASFFEGVEIERVFMRVCKAWREALDKEFLWKERTKRLIRSFPNDGTVPVQGPHSNSQSPKPSTPSTDLANETTQRLSDPLNSSDPAVFERNLMDLLAENFGFSVRSRGRRGGTNKRFQFHEDCVDSFPSFFSHRNRYKFVWLYFHDRCGFCGVRFPRRSKGICSGAIQAAQYPLLVCKKGCLNNEVFNKTGLDRRFCLKRKSDVSKLIECKTTSNPVFFKQDILANFSIKSMDKKRMKRNLTVQRNAQKKIMEALVAEKKNFELLVSVGYSHEKARRIVESPKLIQYPPENSLLNQSFANKLQNYNFEHGVMLKNIESYVKRKQMEEKSVGEFVSEMHRHPTLCEYERIKDQIKNLVYGKDSRRSTFFGITFPIPTTSEDKIYSFKKEYKDEDNDEKDFQVESEESEMEKIKKIEKVMEEKRVKMVKGLIHGILLRKRTEDSLIMVMKNEIRKLNKEKGALETPDDLPTLTRKEFDSSVLSLCLSRVTHDTDHNFNVKDFENLNSTIFSVINEQLDEKNEKKDEINEKKEIKEVKEKKEKKEIKMKVKKEQEKEEEWEIVMKERKGKDLKKKEKNMDELKIFENEKEGDEEVETKEVFEAKKLIGMLEKESEIEKRVEKWGIKYRFGGAVGEMLGCVIEDYIKGKGWADFNEVLLACEMELFSGKNMMDLMKLLLEFMMVHSFGISHSQCSNLINNNIVDQGSRNFNDIVDKSSMLLDSRLSPLLSFCQNFLTSLQNAFSTHHDQKNQTTSSPSNIDDSFLPTLQNLSYEEEIDAVNAMLDVYKIKTIRTRNFIREFFSSQTVSDSNVVVDDFNDIDEEDDINDTFLEDSKNNEKTIGKKRKRSSKKEKDDKDGKMKDDDDFVKKKKIQKKPKKSKKVKKNSEDEDGDFNLEKEDEKEEEEVESRENEKEDEEEYKDDEDDDDIPKSKRKRSKKN